MRDEDVTPLPYTLIHFLEHDSQALVRNLECIGGRVTELFSIEDNN